MIYQQSWNLITNNNLDAITKKWFLKIMIAVMVIQFLFVMPLIVGASTDAGNGIYSLFWNVEFKDGDKLNNWDDALEIGLTFENTSIDGTLYAKNDWNVLYLGLLLEEGFMLTPNMTTTVTLYWDATNDRQKADDVKEIVINATRDSTILTRYDYFVSSSANVVLDQGGTEFLATAYSVSLGQSSRDLLEIKIPLTTDYPLEDFQVYQPEDFPLGLGIFIERRYFNGTLVLSTGWHVNFTDLIDASIHATFILAGPSDVKIPAYQQSAPAKTGTTIEVSPEEEALRGDHGAAGAVPGWDYLSWFMVFLAAGMLVIGLQHRKMRRNGD